MTESSIGFAVLYRWHLRPGHEAGFADAWELVTKRLMAERGALGSRLHRVEGDVWAAYAQWPSKEAWNRSRELGSIDEGASKVMAGAIAESYEPILMTPVRDHLAARRERS